MKVDTVVDSRLLRGTLFQCLGAAALKDRFPCHQTCTGSSFTGGAGGASGHA